MKQLQPGEVCRGYVKKYFLQKLYAFFSYKNLVYKNVKAWNCSKIKNIAVILLVAISISVLNASAKKRCYYKKKVY